MPQCGSCQSVEYTSSGAIFKWHKLRSYYCFSNSWQLQRGPVAIARYENVDKHGDQSFPGILGAPAGQTGQGFPYSVMSGAHPALCIQVVYKPDSSPPYPRQSIRSLMLCIHTHAPYKGLLNCQE